MWGCRQAFTLSTEGFSDLTLLEGVVILSDGTLRSAHFLRAAEHG